MIPRGQKPLIQMGGSSLLLHSSEDLGCAHKESWHYINFLLGSKTVLHNLAGVGGVSGERTGAFN